MISLYKYTILILLLLIVSCSSKNTFKPLIINGSYKKIKNIEYKLKNIKSNHIILSNNSVIINEKSNTKIYNLRKNYQFINYSDNKIISTNNRGKMLVDNTIINIDNILIASSIKNSILANIYSNNSFSLYNLKTKRYILKEYLSPSLINDKRVSNPIFMENILLIPTLNGKVIVINIKENKIIKNITIDDNIDFNNIIYIKIIEEKIFIATKNIIILIANKTFKKKRYNISHIASNNQNIYLSTIDGKIIKLDLELNIIKENKFKFAKFYALAITNFIYAVESQGLLIKMDKNLKKQSIYKININENDEIGVQNNKIYFGKKIIELE
jgi:hypothetical protein